MALLRQDSKEGWEKHRHFLLANWSRVLPIKVERSQVMNSSVDLLEFALVGTTKVQPVKRFVASDFFKVSTKKNGLVKIYYIGDSFKAWFLDKIEDRQSVENCLAPGEGLYRTPGRSNGDGVYLRYQTLKQSFSSVGIINRLGGEDKAQTDLAEIAACLNKQPNGENGALLVNNHANIFYVRDVNAVLRTVRVGCFGGHWDVHAYPIEHPYEWDNGDRVFSGDC